MAAKNRDLLLIIGGIVVFAFFGTALLKSSGTNKAPEITKAPETTIPENGHISDEEPLHTSPVFLPGTQPRDLEQEIAWPRTCKGCHGDYADYSPYDTWKGSMMSVAAVDPLFLALNAISNRDLEGVVEVGDYCLRCHTPDGWLGGRSEPVDASELTKEDRKAGVSCDFCHRLVDPLTEEGKKLSRPDTTVHANGQYVVSPDGDVRRGPYPDPNAPHKAVYSEFYRSSELCATCHEIYNPVYDLTTPVETTYSEWKYSDFSRENVECQDCHMPKVEGYAGFSGTAPLRPDVYKHEMAGASTWVIDAIIALNDLDSDRVAALGRTKNLSIYMLQSAALLDLNVAGDMLWVNITNQGGHKLPTGYPEGKRMWINVRFYNAEGDIIRESGRYDPEEAVLVNDSELKVYEAKPGLKDVSGHPDGPSFHFALNNWIYKDNRIPPRGFTNKEYENAMAYIRGAEYADGQYWDTTEYTIPEGAVRASVRLLHQSGTREFLEFLRDENIENPWDVENMGEKVYNAWVETGKAPPVEMASANIEL